MSTIYTEQGRLQQPSGPANMPSADPDGACCWGAVAGDGCTCWTAVLDVHPTPVVQEGPHLIRRRMCADCAYRPGSPEREELDGDTPGFTRSDRFYCHAGMPRAVGYRHPTLGDVVVPAPTTDDYRPFIRDGRPWKADGSPAELCSGWAAHTGARRLAP